MSEKALVLRCVRSDMSSSCIRFTDEMFFWPREGPVRAPDWDPKPECGGGLHGWLWGEGELGSCGYWDNPKNHWLVVEVDSTSIIDLESKVKFPEGNVVFCGEREEAVAYLMARAPAGKAIMFANANTPRNGTAIAGDYGTATAGHHGIATAGYYGITSTGHYGTATAGYHGTATAGDYGTATVCKYGTAIAGHHGTATAGYRGTATTGECGIATAGHHGTATAGDYGTASAGYRGKAIVGNSGKASAGVDGIIVITPSLSSPIIGKIGVNGIKANTLYRLNDEGQFIPA